MILICIVLMKLFCFHKKQQTTKKQLLNTQKQFLIIVKQMFNKKLSSVSSVITEPIVNLPK